MQTYIIVVHVADERRYVKFIDSNEEGIVVQFVPKKIDASLFSGEQIEEYVPMIKSQQHVFLNNNTAYYNHNLRIYAEKYAEVTLQ
jgi:hypothetical protein